VYIAPRLRQEDKDEIAAASDRTPMEVLSEAVTFPSTQVIEIAATGEPIALFGCDESGVIWMLGTYKTITYQKRILRGAKQFIAECLKTLPKVHNFIFSENIRHVRWIAHLGFQVGPRVELRNGHFFYYFWKDSDVR
jgi:hypothetical protein